MPMPVSRTEIRTSRPGTTAACTVTPPTSVNLIAFAIRLRSTRASLTLSARRRIGGRGSPRLRRRPFARACGSNARHSSARSSSSENSLSFSLTRPESMAEMSRTSETMSAIESAFAWRLRASSGTCAARAGSSAVWRIRSAMTLMVVSGVRISCETDVSSRLLRVLASSASVRRASSASAATLSPCQNAVHEEGFVRRERSRRYLNCVHRERSHEQHQRQDPDQAPVASEGGENQRQAIHDGHVELDPCVPVDVDLRGGEHDRRAAQQYARMAVQEIQQALARWHADPGRLDALSLSDRIGDEKFGLAQDPNCGR